MPGTEDQAKLLAARHRLDRLAWLMDECIPLPGTNRRFGLDPIIGLIPGAGDAVGAALSLWLVAEAARLGAPGRLLARMVGNVLLEAIVGLVPVLGDLFDFWWKANSRNLELLRDYIDHQVTPEVHDRTWYWIVLAAIAVLLLLLMFYTENLLGPL